jgi:cytochrome c-type biogenesis protein
MNLFVAFLAGILTFFSPCFFPLVPSYISYITGSSIEELSAGNKAHLFKRSMMGSLFFVMGFSVIFILLGILASFAGSLVYEFQNYLRIVGGIVVIFFGLTLTGILKIRSLETEKRFGIKNRPAGYAGAFFLGMTFAAGWVPCVGPILSSMLAIASTSGSRFFGGLLLLSYCIGLGVPVIASVAAFDYFLVFYRKAVKRLKYVSVICGVILIITGVLLISDSLTPISGYLNNLFGSSVTQ